MPRITRAIGYVRPGVGDSVTVQQTVVRDATHKRSWRLLKIFEEDPGVGPTLDRPQLRRALEYVSEGEAHVLVVSSMDRLALSVKDVATLLRWFEAASGPRLVVVGGTFTLDTTREQEHALASALAALGEWDRAAASQRAQEVLQACQLRGLPISRPAVSEHRELTSAIQRLRDAGLTLQQIADRLNEAGVPTLRGGEYWRPSSLQAVLAYRRPPRGAREKLPPPQPEPPPT
jgi:DNA invertase Pin-like site-specific DNA recombinase